MTDATQIEPSPAGRHTKLTPALQKKMIKLLKTGVTVTDACAHVGIAQGTYYNWIEWGHEGKSPYLQFLEAVTRAHNNAKVIAIGTIRTALTPYKQTSVRTETYTETRLTKNGDPYEYKEERVVSTVTVMPGDWRAAMEYLKRRFPDEWSDRVNVQGDMNIKVDWRDEFQQQGKDGEQFMTIVMQLAAVLIDRPAEEVGEIIEGIARKVESK